MCKQYIFFAKLDFDHRIKLIFSLNDYLLQLGKLLLQITSLNFNLCLVSLLQNSYPTNNRLI
jgi:hypothetical protein